MSKRYDNKPIDERHVREQLSAYIDGVLPEDERERVRTHLEECDDCRVEYDELRATQHILQQMPVVAAPRAFTLTEEMAARVRKPSLLRRIFTPRLAPTFATGSVVAFVALIVLLAGSLLSPSTHNAFGVTVVAPERNIAQPSTGSEVQPNISTDTGATSSTPTDGTAGFAYGGESSTTSTTGASLVAPKAPAATPPAQEAQPKAYATPAPPSTGGSQVAPNTNAYSIVEGSGTTSPTTVTLDQNQPGFYNRFQPPAGGGSGAQNPGQRESPSQEQAEIRLDLMWILVAGLLVLGILLGVAALIARRQNS